MTKLVKGFIISYLKVTIRKIVFCKHCQIVCERFAYFYLEKLCTSKVINANSRHKTMLSFSVYQLNNFGNLIILFTTSLQNSSCIAFLQCVVSSTSSNPRPIKGFIIFQKIIKMGVWKTFPGIQLSNASSGNFPLVHLKKYIF